MVTPDEIARIPLFATLDEAQREQLSRLAADISLAAGEYAAPHGSDQALFAVLDGRIEPIHRADGVERVVGERHPGDIFGEVPITLGTVFPVGFRAAVPSRVMRIEPRDYHAIASASPSVASEVGRLAAHRMSGLRGYRDWPRTRRRRARWWSGTAWIPPAPSSGASSTATRWSSTGCRRTRRPASSAGAARRRPPPTCRRSASSAARR